MPANKNTKSITTVVIIILVLAIGGFGAYKMFAGKNKDKTDSTTPVYTVKRGPLTISIAESGTIKPQEQVILKSEIEGRTTILWIIPEATMVKKGELLVDLDATSLKDDLLRQQITVQKADASYVQAREDLAVGESQAQSDVEKAELTLEFAKQDEDKYLNGEYPNLLKEAQAKITLNKEKEERAADTYLSSQELAKDKYISELELKSDKLSWEEAKLNRELSESDLELLKNYTYKRQIAELKSDVKQAEMELDRTKRKAKANLVQYDAQLKSAESVLQRERDILKKIEDQIGKAKIYAPADGLVVYATSTRGSWRGNQEPLDVGEEVHEHEELIYLPTANSVKAELNIHESSLNKVFPGMPATVTVDALPGNVYYGEVKKIAILPDAQMIWMNPDLKVYTTEVYVEGDTSDLRTGMSCNVEITVEHLEDTLYVPVQSVVRVGDERRVYLLDGKNSVPRKVEVGLDNNRMIHIKSGLSVGDKVMLDPPLSDAEVVRNRRGNMGGRPKVEGAEKKPAGPKPEGQTKKPPRGGPKPGAGKPGSN